MSPFAKMSPFSSLSPPVVVADHRAKAAAGMRRRAWLAAISLGAGLGTLLAGSGAAVTAALAQGAPAAAILIDGNAVVTGFSGLAAGAPTADAQDATGGPMIDLAGPSARVIDLQTPGAPPHAQLLRAPKPFTVTAAQVGQVFAVTLDTASPPNIYLGATSAYGLPIVTAGPGGAAVQTRQGGVEARFMPGLFGPADQGGGPGSIWRVDGRSGAVRLFANVTLDGVPNSGPALGGLAFDPVSGTLFAADRETGMIHGFDRAGIERSRFDHGVAGREAAGLPPVAYDPGARAGIASPAFAADDPATWGYAALERRVYGLAVHAGRLYYAVADGLQVWSVSLRRDGGFGADARVEVELPPWDGESEIGKIAFDDEGRMLLAERPAPTGAQDLEAVAKAGVGRVLRYRPAPARVSSVAAPVPASGLWVPDPDAYAIGFAAQLRNGNGGIAIGYGYTRDGHLDRAACGEFLWSTGEELRAAADPAVAARLASGGPAIVDGLQGNGLDLVRPANVPPLQTYFADYDDRFDDAAARGHIGDVAIWRTCGHPAAGTTVGSAIAVEPVADFGDDGGEIEIRLPLCRHGAIGHEGDREDFRHRRCCPREDFHDGRCWHEPPHCPRGTIRLPNGTCCDPATLRDGRCLPPPPPTCPPGEIRLPHGQCCPRGDVRDGRCVPPPPPTCPRGEIRLPHGQCCPIGEVRDGRCLPPPPPTCKPGTVRLPGGRCEPVRRSEPRHPPVLLIPPRHVVHVPPPPRHAPIVRGPIVPRQPIFAPRSTGFRFSPPAGPRPGLMMGRMAFGSMHFGHR